MITVPEYDMHVHTVLCGHAHESATIERMSAHAAVLKMKLLCFAEHVHCMGTLEELKQLRDKINAVQSACSCKLLLGAEIDCDEKLHDGSLVVNIPEWLDFVIGSIHFSHPEWPEVNENLFTHWQQSILGLSHNRKVDMIGHPGAFIFNADNWQKWRLGIYETFHQAAANSASIGQAWDMNNLTLHKLRGRAREQYWKVMQIAYDKGVRLYYGSDSHHISSLGRIGNVMSILKNIPALEPDRIFRLPPELGRRFNIS
jgi:putative hydrolase